MTLRAVLEIYFCEDVLLGLRKTRAGLSTPLPRPLRLFSYKNCYSNYGISPID